MSWDRFARNGSPLGGRLVPRDWKSMDHQAKQACLVANGWAHDFYDAGRVLALHAAAAMQDRKARCHRAEMARRRWDD
jgi:hypothetical protein